MHRLVTPLIVILLLIVLLLYALTLGLISSMHSSDPAGNGLTQSFTFLTTTALWVFLAALLITARMKGAMPGWASAAALVLVPASGAAALVAVNLLTDTFYKSKWQMMIPTLAPALIIMTALWPLIPTLRGFISSS